MKEFAPSGSKFFPLREVSICKGRQLKRITACSSSLPLVCVTFPAFWLCHWLIWVKVMTSTAKKVQQAKDKDVSFVISFFCEIP